MSEPDVVALLDQWIAALKGHPAAWAGISHEEIERARDEIVALREMRKGVLSTNRAEALEAAARVCERVPGDPKYGDFFAKAIRTLKDKRDG